jgi:hypothetical protein
MVSGTVSILQYNNPIILGIQSSNTCVGGDYGYPFAEGFAVLCGYSRINANAWDIPGCMPVFLGVRYDYKKSVFY